MQQRDLVIDYQGLEYLGFATPRRTRWNLPSTTLVQLALVPWRGPAGRGWRAAHHHRPAYRALARTTASSSTSPASATASTGARSTGRSRPSRGASACGPRCGRMSLDRELYVSSGYAGADPQYRLPAAHRDRDGPGTACSPTTCSCASPIAGEGARDVSPPMRTSSICPGLRLAEPATDGTRSSRPSSWCTSPSAGCADRRHRYAGEIKKSIFGLLKYLLPQRACSPCTAPPTRASGTTSRCSLGCPARARPRCRPIPSAG